jgi:hypothetical protein
VDLCAANEDHIRRLAAEGLVTVQGDRLSPTRDGLAVADGLARSFDLDPS